jgi:hypothetical protein
LVSGGPFPRREKRRRCKKKEKEKELTERMEDDAGFHDIDADHLQRLQTLSGGHVASHLLCCLLGLSLDDSVADILDEERQEQPGHQDGSRGSLVFQPAEALVAKHEFSVGEQLFVIVSARCLLVNLTGRLLTWTRAVDKMTPVPNCLTIKSAVFALVDRYCARRMGANTPVLGQLPYIKREAVTYRWNW